MFIMLFMNEQQVINTDHLLFLQDRQRVGKYVIFTNPPHWASAHFLHNFFPCCQGISIVGFGGHFLLNLNSWHLMFLPLLFTKLAKFCKESRSPFQINLL